MLNLYRLKELTLFDFYYSLANLKSLAFIILYFFFWFIFFQYISKPAVEWLQSAHGFGLTNWFFDKVLNDRDQGSYHEELIKGVLLILAEAFVSF